MDSLDTAKRRVEAMLGEIHRLQEFDFPYLHSKAALDLIEGHFTSAQSILNGLKSNNSPSVIRVKCQESLMQIEEYLPTLGFIIRSTHVRNSFEVFGPLLRLSRKIVDPDTKLILSSEWYYSPHVYGPISGLPNFVLLGLPASEAGNPLLIPIAGHELGHTAWQRKKLRPRFTKSLEDALQSEAAMDQPSYEKHFGVKFKENLFLKQNLAPAFELAIRQCEESFCDFVGVRVFFESYFYAFAYLITPGGFLRDTLYPSQSDRIANMLAAAKKCTVTPPSNFATWFEGEKSQSLTEKEEYLLKLADAARQSLVPSLIKEAKDMIDSAGIPAREEPKVTEVLRAFKLTVPAQGIGDLSALLNAAWKIHLDDKFWTSKIQNRFDALCELVLKSCEIMEYESKVSA